MLAPFKLERFFAKYEFTTKYLLSSSDVEAMSLRELLEFEPGSKEGLDNLWLGYTESVGSPYVREAIASLYKNVRADQVVSFVGAQEAIYCFMKSYLSAGDHIIVLKPAYQSLYSVARDSGVELSDWYLRPDAKAWSLDISELKKLVRPSTKALILNLPNSPTGFLPSHEEFQEIVGFCREHGIILFCDEVYRGLEYGEKKQLPAACEAYEKGISLGVLSKTYGLPGLRLGWLATQDAEVIEKAAVYKDFTTICSPAPSEFLGALALRHHESLAKRSRQIILENLKNAEAFFEDFGEIFHWRKPEASPVCLIELKGDLTAENFSEQVREKQGVLLLPSSLFDMEDRYLRFGFGRTNFAEALGALRLFIESRLSCLLEIWKSRQ